MLYEQRFDRLTRGLVQGPSIIHSVRPVVSPLIKRKGEFVLWDTVPVLWKEVVATHKVVIRSRESGEEIWVRGFATKEEAFFCYLSLTGLNPNYSDRPFYLPSTWLDGDLEYRYATVTTFNASNSTASPWGSGGCQTPSGVSTTDYLVVGGGASGGNGGGGGGGGGGVKAATAFTPAAPGSSNTITVGTGGAAQFGVNATGNDGNNSVFQSVTASKGSGGGGGGTAASNNAAEGGGGGGPRFSGFTGGTSVSGGAGGNGNTPCGGGGGGGGSGASAGTAASGTVAGNGGNGTSSSITGSSVTYAGGGGGSGYSGAGATAPGTGTNGGGNGGTVTGGAGGAATANTGGGGGGGGGDSSGGLGGSGAGGAGVIILSWSQAFIILNNSFGMEPGVFTFPGMTGY